MKADNNCEIKDFAFSMPRRFPKGNPLGLRTLVWRQFKRFFGFGFDSLGGPLVFSLLMISVITVALGMDDEIRPGTTTLAFIIPGLAAYNAFFGAFENAAHSIVFDKLEGIISDVLMSPLRPWEVLLGYVIAATLAGLMTGLVVIIPCALLFGGIPLVNPLIALGYTVLGSAIFALLGFLLGLWAPKWDKLSGAETFIVLPIGVLSGTFYSIEAIPAAGQFLLTWNPVFYAVNGVRAGFLGWSDGSALLGLALLIPLLVGLFGITLWLLARGYQVKS